MGDNDRFAAAAVATAAALLGAYSLYKVFSSSDKIRVINNIADCRRELNEIKQHCRTYNVLGIDCEWVNGSGRQPIALLQLQSVQGLCLLIRLPYVGMPEELRELLENHRILKVGVGVDLDAKYLFDDHRVRVRSTLDLRYMAVLAKCQPGKLSKMAEEYLKLELDKNEVFSDWNAHILSEQQIEYASKDVHASIELFKHFVDRIYDGWIPRNDKDRVQYVIERFCSRFLDLQYNGSQGIPHDVIRQRMLN